MNSTWFKRTVAVILIFTLALISPMQFVKTEKSEAAAKNVKYIKEFKLFIKKKGTQADAENWCKSQTDGDWHVVEGDLNAGTDGTFSKPVGVFLCYTTTNDVKEAVTDLAVMNEKGNYSESAYEEILKQQKDSYKDMVKNLKIQVEGYQENYKKKVKTAIEAHDQLNGYKEDDSGKLLGDLLAELNLDVEADADKLTDILLQANGNVVLFIQQELSLACESGTRSWLDRMEQVGGYDKFYDKIKTAFNGDDSLAKKNMDKKYKEKATVIADDWDNLKSHLENVKKYEEKCGVSKMTEEQVKAWRENNLNSADGTIYEQEVALINNLSKYKYEGKTLLEFFSQDKSEISGDKLHMLYPMASCLQAGQFAGIDTTVNLYSLINQAFSATVLNDYNKGKLGEVKDEMSAEQNKEMEKAREKVEEAIDQQQKNTSVVSIYEGVDREIFNGGVAVTSDAMEYSKGSETKWMDYLYDGEGKTTQGIVAFALFGLGTPLAFMYVYYLGCLKQSSVEVMKWHANGTLTSQFSETLIDEIDTVDSWNFDKVYDQIEKWASSGNQDSKDALKELHKVALAEQTDARILNKLVTGCSIVFILLAAADIAVNVYALYQYYNREHLPIPKRIVDMSTNKEKETTYVTYKTVPDNNGSQGDLNGGESKQWLALYQTKDDRAGRPIAAPESGYPIKVVYGDNERYYLPAIHMFGMSSTTPQNLTFADGESGWSYNDEKNGTYLYFTRYDGPIIDEADKTTAVSDDVSDSASGSATDADKAGTALSGGVIALIACGAVVVILFAFFAINNSRKRKTS